MANPAAPTTGSQQLGYVKPCTHLPDGGCETLTRCVMIKLPTRQNFKTPKGLASEWREYGGCYCPQTVFAALYDAYFRMGGILPDRNEMHVYMHLMNEPGTRELVRLNFEGFASARATRFYLQIIPMDVGRYPDSLKKWVAAWWFGRRGGLMRSPFTDYDMPHGTPIEKTETLWQIHGCSREYVANRAEFEASQAALAHGEEEKAVAMVRCDSGFVEGEAHRRSRADEDGCFTVCCRCTRGDPACQQSADGA